MMAQISAMATFVVDSFLRLWPYLLVTIPLAVAARMSRASKYINKAFRARPVIAIILATVVGAFSPFCSCGVIPIINGLLVSGVPLAPVMSFWIASPSMDPEIFFLSVATIGWDLAVWRLVSTLLISLGAGFLTHYLEKNEWLGRQVLRSEKKPSSGGVWESIREKWRMLKSGLISAYQSLLWTVTATPILGASCCSGKAGTVMQAGMTTELRKLQGGESLECEIEGGDDRGNTCAEKPASFTNQLASEIWGATSMVIKFMILAFLMEAIIEIYIPSEWISGLIGGDSPWSILAAAFLGVPAYTSSLASLPMIGGLLSKGMTPAAGLAFLIAGPTTTLPAMTAVWGIVSRRVFSLYIAISLIGAILFGYAFNLLG